MPVDFPIRDIRKNPDGTWSCLYISEGVTVPLLSPYVARLEEVPSNGTISGTTAPSISGLSYNYTYPPSTGQFWINFTTGDVIFNVAQAGQSFTVNYYGKGTLIEAADINFIYDTLTEHISASDEHGATGAIVGTLNTQTLENKSNKLINIKASSEPTSAAPEEEYLYLRVSGTTPNKNILTCLKNELGEEIIISSLIM